MSSPLINIQQYKLWTKPSPWAKPLSTILSCQSLIIIMMKMMGGKNVIKQGGFRVGTISPKRRHAKKETLGGELGWRNGCAKLQQQHYLSFVSRNNVWGNFSLLDLFTTHTARILNKTIGRPQCHKMYRVQFFCRNHTFPRNPPNFSLIALKSFKLPIRVEEETSLFMNGRIGE